EGPPPSPGDPVPPPSVRPDDVEPAPAARVQPVGDPAAVRRPVRAAPPTREDTPPPVERLEDDGRRALASLRCEDDRFPVRRPGGCRVLRARGEPAEAVPAGADDPDPVPLERAQPALPG